MTITADTIINALADRHRAHIDLDGMGRMYLRLTIRRIGPDNRPVRALDLADIAVDDEHQGQGVFAAALRAVEEAAVVLGAKAVYIESVVNPIVAQAVERRGYTQTADSHPSMPNYGRLVGAAA